MRGRKSAGVPLPLSRAAKRFEDWRQSHSIGTRIPKSLWALAVELATTYGVSRTAAVLRLNYYDLQKRRRAGVSQPDTAATPSPVPTFIELAASTLVAPAECILEFENAAGSKMRIHLKGAQTPDLVALSGSFWRAQQ